MSVNQERQRQLERTDRRIIVFRMMVGFAIVLILGLQLVSNLQILNNQATNGRTLSQVSTIRLDIQTLCRANPACRAELPHP